MGRRSVVRDTATEGDRTQAHNVGCIARAAEAAADGKVAEYDDVRRLWLVPSRSGRNRARYQVHVLAHPEAGLASATCTCEAGHTQAPQGSAPCWHGAAGLVEAQLLDLVEFDGRVWRLTDVGRELAEGSHTGMARPTHVDDPDRWKPGTPPKAGSPEYAATVAALVD